ncbi:MAG: hypothetical protein AAFS11_07175 [Planctomycetota bacterium]
MSAVASLRKRFDAGEVRVALQLAEGRRRLAGKVEHPERWLADSDGAQMATDRLIAQHKARRFAELRMPILDVCSGVGADARELAEAGPVACVELDPCRAVMCRYNTGRPVLETDAAELELPPNALVHIDPARRSGAKRIVSLGDLLPGPGVIDRIVRNAAGAAVKLMPGVDRADIEDVFAGIGGELEHISLRGRMSQAVWWTGNLAPSDGLARATIVTDDGIESIAGLAAPADALLPLGDWLYAVDPAPERAGLLGRLAESLGVGVLHPKLGVLTSDERVASPWLTAFRVLEHLPWRVERVREAVASLGGGIVEVKTRGGAVDPDRAQRELRGTGETTLTVFVLRFGSAIEAIITERDASRG